MILRVRRIIVHKRCKMTHNNDTTPRLVDPACQILRLLINSLPNSLAALSPAWPRWTFVSRISPDSSGFGSRSSVKSLFIINSNGLYTQFLFRCEFFSSIVKSKIDLDCKPERSIVGFHVQLIFYRVSACNSQRMRRNRPNKSPKNCPSGKSVAHMTFSGFASLLEFLKISGSKLA